MREIEKETFHIGHYDISDRKHPERAGRYVNLTALLEMLVYLADEPDGGIHQIREVLLKVARS